MTAQIKAQAVLLPDSNSLARLTATEYLNLLRSGEVSVLDYVTACADQIDLAEPQVHAWTWYDRDRMIAAVRGLDARVNQLRRDGLAIKDVAMGVPLAVKDIFNTADMPTGHGSDIFADYNPGNDARVVTSLLRAGAIAAGKTVTAEFAVHAPGKTHNPIDLRRSCGTSSSGSAAAVAACMAPIALGSQTAGSTIRPASYCGVYGFKPSFGLLPRTAMLKTTDTLDTVGLLARSVPDIRLMFDLCRVWGPNYPVVDREMSDPARLAKGAGPWRVGVVQGPKSHLESEAVKQRMAQVVAKLEAAGCIVEPFRLPKDFDHAHDVHETIYRRALAYYFRMEWAKARDRFSPVLADMIDAGLSIPVEDYHAATREQHRLAVLMEQELGRFDVVICPSTADEAPLGLDAADIPDHNLIWTMCHLPSLGLPALSGTTGLPVGLQIASRRFNDYIVLQFADHVAGLFAS